MTVRELQDKIIQLKRESDTCILAHSYMSQAISEVADFTGDSYALAVRAKSATNKNVIMCGVRFMAETVKMLSPDKRVVLSDPNACCPMAEQFGAEDVEALKERFAGYAVVAYINTTAELKTVADVCVTSSSAVKICRAIPEQNIIFIPDINLGSYVKKQIPEKNLKLVSGGCPVHARIEEEDAERAKAEHPDALLLVHPECRPGVVKYADFVGSTSAIMEYAENSDAHEFIIGTENSILEHLQFACPDKSFYPLSKHMICPNMKLTTLADVYNCLLGEAGEEIELDGEIMEKGVKCIEKMIEYGG